MTSEAPPRTLREMIAAIFRVVGYLGPGDRSELRRYRRGHGAIPLPYYRIAASAELPAGQEERWATLAACSAILGNGSGGVPLGQALGEAGYSELRLSRLLRASAERLHEDLPGLAQYLAVKGANANFGDAALLLLLPDHDEPRQSIARSYYRALRATA